MKEKVNLKKVLAVDLGATSGRGIIAEDKNDEIILKEIARFENKTVKCGNKLYWDFDALWQNVQNAVRLGVAEGAQSVGIDTWGVDYGLIDENGKLFAPPRHYRDRRTENSIKEVSEKIIPLDEYYKITGTAPSFINTVYQLWEEKKTTDLSGKKMLLMPDLFAYLLTGEMRAEYTIASTTGLLNLDKKAWNFELIEKFGFPKALFPKIIMPGEIYGCLKEFPNIPLVAVGSHDTASAVCDCEEDEVFISSGTWSLIGFLTDFTITKNAAYTNEGCLGGKITYLKNIMGMWLQNEVKRNLAEKGENYSWGELSEMLANAKDIKSTIDPNAQDFELPADMTGAIKNYCRKTNQEEPQTIGETLRIVNNSLASAYKKAIDELTEIRGKKFKSIRIVGGGSANAYLSKKTAELTGLNVFIGPVEATAIGNVKVQFSG